MTTNEETSSTMPPANWWEIPISTEFAHWMRDELRDREFRRMRDAYYANPSPSRQVEIHGERHFRLLTQSYLCHTPAARLLELAIQAGLLKLPGDERMASAFDQRGPWATREPG